jgi:hypothetical protein
MAAPATIEKARDDLRARLEPLEGWRCSLGNLLEAVREQFQREPEREAGAEGAAAELEDSLLFETYGRDDETLGAEIIRRWETPGAPQAPVWRLRLRFDLPASPASRAVEVRSRDYPEAASFVTAALEASEVPEDAPASNVRIDLDVE